MRAELCCVNSAVAQETSLCLHKGFVQQLYGSLNLHSPWKFSVKEAWEGAYICHLL